LHKVAEYVKREQDPDLIVHAIRFLRESSSTTSSTTLLSLLNHASWQVRAEAAEAIANQMKSARYGSAPENAAEIYDALLARLEDPDAFVVSRAIDGLFSIDTKRAVAPLVKTVVKHPALAAPVLDILSRGSVMRDDAVPHFREFLRHTNPAVRSAAIGGLCRTEPDGVKDDLLSALGDDESIVRAAAATALLGIMPTPSRMQLLTKTPRKRTASLRMRVSATNGWRNSTQDVIARTGRTSCLTRCGRCCRPVTPRSA
jgi:HEAT repeat protein